MHFDRRIIFLLVFIAVGFPIIWPLYSPVTVTPEVRNIFEDIQKLPAGSPILIAIDYEPSDSPEVDPMTIAILQHCFRRNLRVIVCSTWPTDGTGAGIAERWLKKVSAEMNKVKGKDYVNLGFKTGTYAVVIGMGENLRNTFPKDYTGNDVNSLEVMKGINSLKDFPYMVCIHDDSSVFTWITYGYERYGIKIASGCTAVMAVGNYAALNAKQLTGIIGGLKGASEYEKLNNTRGWASNGMDSQSVMHFFIIGLLILGNIMYFTKDGKKLK
jgi:hypothetical protein